MDFEDIDIASILKGIGIALAVFIIGGGLLMALINSGVGSSRETCTKGKYLYNEETHVCEADSQYVYDKIAIVIGNTANTPAPAFPQDEDGIERIVKNSLLAYNTSNDAKTFSNFISIFSADSRHNKLTLTEPKTRSGENVETALANVDVQFASLASDLHQAPSANGAAYFDAIASAAREVKNAKKPLVIVLGSGLSDSGTLNFTTNDLLYEDADKILSRLEANKSIKSDSMSGVTILWAGLGNVTSPQTTLDEKDLNHLREIYETIFDYTGAKADLEAGALSGASLTTDYTVEPIKLQPAVIDLTEDELKFQGSSADFIDAAAARETIAQIIREKVNSTSQITVEGYVSIGVCGRTADQALSEARANAVKQLFIDNGVSANRIVAVGKGKGPADECAGKSNGASQDETIAKQNRKVVITIE